MAELVTRTMGEWPGQDGGLFCGFDARPGLDVGRYKATRLSRLN